MNTNLFIVGTTRSGTSAIRNAIAETRFKGPGEGHSVGLLGVISDAIETYFYENRAALPQGTMLAAWKRDVFWNDISAAYTKQIREFVSTGDFIDKTPNILPIRYASLIEASLEDVRFIYCRRRGVDNVLSKCRKWPELPFLEHCTEWTDINDAWDNVKLRLSSPALEAEYYDLATAPEVLTGRIGDFLELSTADRAVLMTELSKGRPTGDPWVSLANTGWSEAQMEEFRAVCGPAMERCGYGYDSYWASESNDLTADDADAT
jgi:hypothetical protein